VASYCLIDLKVNKELTLFFITEPIQFKE